MTLFSSGLCFLLMAIFYWLIDCCGFSRGFNWLKVYGMNPITAYMLGEVINFRSIVSSVSFGLEPILGQYYSAWLTFGNFLILFLLLRFMYNQKIFLKV
jgi:predicted acyltransferase